MSRSTRTSGSTDSCTSTTRARVPASPGGCVNRVSRFTMSGDTIDPASEIVLVDNISSNAGNHNGGDLEIGGDGFLYISVGDAGADPRGDSSPNNAAQDLSLLNGKILRVVPSTGEPAPGNPLSGPGTESCRVRGNLPSTPTTAVPGALRVGTAQPVPLRLRPQHRPAAVLHQRRRARARAKRSTRAGSVATTAGRFARACVRSPRTRRARPRDPGFTDPLTDYGRTVGQVITAGAFIPNGHWPAEYDGGYLFADAGSGNMWLRRPTGPSTTPRRSPPNVGGIADMAFVTTHRQHRAVLHAHRRRRPQDLATRRPRSWIPVRLSFVAVPPGTRVLDSRLPESRATSACEPTPRATCRWVSTRR